MPRIVVTVRLFSVVLPDETARSNAYGVVVPPVKSDKATVNVTFPNRPTQPSKIFLASIHTLSHKPHMGLPVILPAALVFAI